VRLPPTDDALEQEIIGAILRNNELYESVSDVIDA
jgi:hypothetical protein